MRLTVDEDEAADMFISTIPVYRVSTPRFQIFFSCNVSMIFTSSGGHSGPRPVGHAPPEFCFAGTSEKPFPALRDKNYQHFEAPPKRYFKT